MIFLTPAPIQGQTTSTTHFVDLIRPGSLEMSFAIVCPLAKMGDNDRQLLQVGLESLQQDGSGVFGRRAIRQLTDGRGIECRLDPDCVTVTFTTLAASFADSLAMAVSLLKEPAFFDDSINSAIQDLRASNQSFWAWEVQPRPFKLVAATHDEVTDAFHRLIRPETLTVAYGGPQPAKDWHALWIQKSTDWPAGSDPVLPDVTPTPEPAATLGGVETGELIGPEFALAQPKLVDEILALYALGIGKECSLYRISRERHAWSYFQEAFLQPTQKGWEPRLFLAMSPDPENEAHLKALKEELLADVATWNADTLAIVLGMAEANLTRQVPFGPILLNGRPFAADLEDQTLADAYWNFKTGQDWSPTRLNAALQSVSLEAIKAEATAILSGSRLHYLPIQK